MKKLLLSLLLFASAATFMACSSSDKNDDEATITKFSRSWQIQENSATLNYTLNSGLDALLANMGAPVTASTIAAIMEQAKPAIAAMANSELTPLVINSNKTYRFGTDVADNDPYEVSGDELVLNTTVETTGSTVNVAIAAINGNVLTITIPKDYLIGTILGETFAAAMPAANASQVSLLLNAAFTNLEVTIKYNPVL